MGANIFLFFIFNKYAKESCNAASIGCGPEPQICTLLCHWSCEGRAFRFAFVIYYDPCVIFRINKYAIFSLVWIPSLRYHRWMYLLSDLWFAFLDCGHDHVTYPSSGKSVRPSQSFHFKLWPDSPFLTLLFLKEMSFREEGAKTPPASCLFVCFAWFCFLEPQFFIYQRSEMSVQVNNNHTLH